MDYMRKKIPLRGTKYYIDTNGIVFRKIGNQYKMMAVHFTWEGKPAVTLTVKKKVRREFAISRLMRMTFFKELPDKYLLLHKDGNKKNNAYNNFVFLPKEKIGERTGKLHNMGKKVLRFNKLGEKTGRFESARAAGKVSGVSYQTVIDDCNKVNKRPFMHRDFSLRKGYEQYVYL